MLCPIKSAVSEDFTTVSLSDKLIESFYKTQLLSFRVYSKIGKVTLIPDDFYRLINLHHSYIRDLVEITGHSYEEILNERIEYNKAK